MAKRLGFIVLIAASFVFGTAALAFAVPHPGAGADCASVGCHVAEGTLWSSAADLHAATAAEVLTNGDHNTAEPLVDSCLKCHSAFQYPLGVASMVSTTNQIGPWTLLPGASAWQATKCEVCHDPTSSAPAKLAKYGAWLDGDFSATYTALDVGMPIAYNHVFDGSSAYIQTNYSTQTADPTALKVLQATKLCDSCHDPDDQGGDPSVVKSSVNYGPQGGDSRSFVTSDHAGFGCTDCHKTHDFTPIEDPRTDAKCSGAGCHVAGGPAILGGAIAPLAVHTNHLQADITAPVTTSNRVAYYATSATILLTAIDNIGGFGVAHTYYTLNGAAAVASSTVHVSGAGTYLLRFWSVDIAGNIEATRTVNFTVITPPSSKGTPSTPSTPSSVRHGRSFTTFGYIKRHTAGTYPVTLQFYRYQSGHWVLRKSITARVSNILTFSKYSRSTYVPYSGKWRVRARHYTGGKYLYSGWRYFKAS